MFLQVSCVSPDEGDGGNLVSGPWSFSGRVPQTRIGVPPNRIGYPFPPVRIRITSPLPHTEPRRLCGAGGMPLAFTQEDYLVEYAYSWLNIYLKSLTTGCCYVPLLNLQMFTPKRKCIKLRETENVTLPYT